MATADTGNTVINGTPGSTTGTLSSSGNGDNVDLVVTGTCSATASGAFSVTAPGNVTTNINLNSSKTITVTYTPMVIATGHGVRQCTVQVVDTGTSNVRTTFDVKGNGVAPIITPTASLAFGVVRYADGATANTASMTLQIKNTGEAGQTLTISNFAFSGTGAVDYSPISTPPAGVTAGPTLPATIAPGATSSWTITVNPVAAGASSASLDITSDDPVVTAATTTKSVPLTATGGNAIIGVTPSIPFGTVVQNTTSTTQNIVVSNTATPAGRGAMAVSNATFVNNNANWFKFPGCANSTTSCAQSITGLTSGTANIGVVCNPPANASGTQTASVTVTSDADDTTASTTMLSCTAGRADIVVTTTPLTFGNQLIGTQSAGQTVMIQNTGNVTLNYNVALAQPNAGQDVTQFVLTGAAGCTSNCPISAGSSVMVTVAFKPNSVGAKSAELRVSPLNDPDTAGPIDVDLSGTCIAPHAAYNVTSMAFGNIEDNTTSTAQTLTVTNDGTADLTISVAYLSGTNPGQFSVQTGTTGNPLSSAITVTPNGTTSWTIACKPTLQGALTANFTITSTSNPSPTTQNISLTCTGTRGFLTITPASFDFGGVLENTTPAPTHAFTLTNTGNLPVTNIAVTTTGTGTGYSILSPTFPIASLAAGASVTVTVQFNPLDGSYGGTYSYTFTGGWGSGAATTFATLTLNGDGLSTGFDTSPSNPYPLDFGDIRFDTPTTLPLNVINTSGTPYNVLTLTITPDVNTMNSELVVLNCKKGVNLAVGTANGCPNGTTNYNSPSLNDTMIVNIQCHPNNRIGMIGGTITIHTDIPDMTKRDKVVTLKCNSITGVLNVTPSNVVDFGPIDLDVTPLATTKTVTLKNTGTATMNITAAGTKTGAQAGAFAVTSMPAAAIAPNATYTFDVTYTPTGEKPSNQPDVATITLPLAGAIGTPGMATLSLSGYGIDRHISVAPAPVFPNTFKNPGDKAPVMPVTITNNGDANLNVSAVMLSDYPIWSIVNPDPVDVSGRMSYDFNVKFEPITAGKAPTGHMVIMNNDNGKPIVSVDLDGNGLDRQVEFSPTEINMGYVGIGISTRLSDTGADPTKQLLSVTNNEDQYTFMITRIGVDGGDGAFDVVTKGTDAAPTNTELAPRTTKDFDVVFTPTHEGDFVADANLYLDNADQPHATVRLRGRGLYVDVKGGGGCSAGGGSGGGALMLVLGALLVGRRRRKRAALGAALSVVGISAVAQADTRNLDTALFDPTPATHVNTLQSQSADVGDNGEYAAVALLTYADNPLVLKTTQNTYTPVDNRAMLVLGGAYAFGSRFEAGLRMPLYFQNGQATGMQTDQFQVSQIDSVSRGDATVHIKMNGGAAEALGGDLSYGAAFALSIPTRSSSEFAGTNMPQGRVLGLATLTEGRLVIQANAGGIIRSKERYSSLVQRSGATFAVGGNYRTTDNLWLGAEVFGNVIPGGKTGDPAPMQAYGPSLTETSIEGLGELTYRMSRTATLGFALGRGINSGVGTSNVRGAFVFAYTPGATALAPLPKHVHVEGPNDKDGDGIKDKLDACPNEPEDKDMFEDGDGCPDVDNDNDGIPDDKDKCPLDAEDKDHFQDDDGCPDKDNDGDGIPDDQDKCPLAAEDKDGFQDTDGCPEPDNDNDGIVDKADKCPNEPETINGNSDDDGCPDKGDALVVMSPDRLDLLDNITFDSGGSKISRASKNILGQIGATLRAHPELVRIRLTAHVQPTSNPQKDQALSEARAKAVQQWLVDWGIDPLRLQSSGFGGTKPLVDPKGRGAQAINDRFELIILERK